MLTAWDNPQLIDTDPETVELINGAEAVIQKKISPLAALCDELRKRLEAYKNARNAIEQQERWRHAVALHSEIMEVWKAAFLNARAAVDDYLRNYDLSKFFTGREILVDSLHGRCKPSVGIALSVMQFESERNLRTLAEIPVELAVSCDVAARKLLRVVSTSKYRG